MELHCTPRESRYYSRIEDDEKNVSSADGLEADSDEEEEGAVGGDQTKKEAAAPAELWDLLRPLIGNCELRLLKFEDKEAQVRVRSDDGGAWRIWGQGWCLVSMCGIGASCLCQAPIS